MSQVLLRVLLRAGRAEGEEGDGVQAGEGDRGVGCLSRDGLRAIGDAEPGRGEHVEVFHAGTATGEAGLVANGGRVLSVTALGASVNEAQARAYAAVDRIDWPEGFCRRDIGWRAVGRENA